jgi:hypothetical protein
VRAKVFEQDAARTSKISKEKDMKMTWKKMSAVLGLVLAGALLTATAAAQCSNTEALPKAKLHRQSWEVGRDGASLNLVSDSTDPIVGMWRFQFLVGTTVIDQGIVQWHSDGTEMTNSSRNPDTQSFCMGVWQKVGDSSYKLNHYAISWDPTTSTTTPQGLANIRETLRLAKDGNSFTGTFVINQYDESGNLLANVSGTLTGYRINVNTNLKVLF